MRLQLSTRSLCALAIFAVRHAPDPQMNRARSSAEERGVASQAPFPNSRLEVQWQRLGPGVPGLRKVPDLVVKSQGKHFQVSRNVCSRDLHDPAGLRNLLEGRERLFTIVRAAPDTAAGEGKHLQRVLVVLGNGDLLDVAGLFEVVG